MELRSIEECSAAIQFDGVLYAMRNIRVKRPRDFDFNPKVDGTRGVPQPSPLNLDLLKMPAFVEETNNKIKISSIPFKAHEIKIIETLSKFGKIKSFC